MVEVLLKDEYVVARDDAGNAILRWTAEQRQLNPMTNNLSAQEESEIVIPSLIKALSDRSNVPEYAPERKSSMYSGMRNYNVFHRFVLKHSIK